jgi:hypothetical protein
LFLIGDYTTKQKDARVRAMEKPEPPAARGSI